MTHREQILVQLLERYTDLTTPAGANGQPGSGDYLPLMPSTYTPSVRELERLLVQMRMLAKRGAVAYFGLPTATAKDATFLFSSHQDSAFQQITRRRRDGLPELEAEPLGELRWHVMEWWINARRSTFEPPNITKPNRGKRQLHRPQVDELDGRPLRQVRVSRAAGARQDKALRGVAWLAGNWGLPYEPMLPQEILVAA